MIDGIDYYPKKRKNNPNVKYWALLLLVILMAVYWYFSAKENLETNTPTRIIVSKPQAEPAANTIPISIKPTRIKPKAPEILEHLDELLPTQTL